MSARVVLRVRGVDLGGTDLIDPEGERGWVEGWPAPRVGDGVHLHVTAAEADFVVREVVWMPEGAGQGGRYSDPFVLVELAVVHLHDEASPEEGTR